MDPIQGAPINFFVGGGRYISDNFNMQILDTSNPTCFDNINLTSIMPDMMDNYINSEKAPETESSGNFIDTIIKFFTSPSQNQQEQTQNSIQ